MQVDLRQHRDIDHEPAEPLEGLDVFFAFIIGLPAVPSLHISRDRPRGRDVKAARATMQRMFVPEQYVSALRFAAERHATQRVPGSDLPYLVHVVSVAAEVIAAGDVRESELAVVCALLHDTIEDTTTTHAEISERFGAAVADGVQALSKNATLPKRERMADSLRRIRLQPPAVWAVKVADRITNLAEPPADWTADKRREYVAEAREIADALRGASPALDARIEHRIRDYARYL